MFSCFKGVVLFRKGGFCYTVGKIRCFEAAFLVVGATISLIITVTCTVDL